MCPCGKFIVATIYSELVNLYIISTMSLQITAFYAALLGIIQVVLTLGIVTLRVNDKISIGNGGNQILEYKIRTHGNFVETVPITLLLLAFAEYQKYLSSNYLNIVASTFVIGRLLHAYSMFFKQGKGLHRPIGMVMTIACIASLSILILIKTKL